MKKYLLIGVASFLFTFSTINIVYSVYKHYAIRTIQPTNNSEYSHTSVMITRYDGRSGGTGVIISSAKGSSKILTNAHVCKLTENGGIVRSELMKGIVKSYQISNAHDLCLITVNTNFKVNTVLAGAEPEVYDDAIISGHPHLLPNIVTYGHFSQKELVNIMMGTRPCTEEEATSKETGIYCVMLNGIPIIKSYEAQVVSATIMPGSSGSAVFNNKGELAGLVFAGSGDFGYAMIVPYEYIVNFFDIELPNLPMNYPNTNVQLQDSKKVNWNQVCSGDVDSKIQEVCSLINKSLLLTN